MSKTARPLHEAEAISTALVADLEPFCVRIAVAGSIRRRKEMVGDIEIVVIPRYEPVGLFGDMQANALWAHLHDAGDRYRFVKGDKPDGRYYQLTLPAHDDLQLDLFLAQPDNWGWILLMRTGSAAFSAGVLGEWKRRRGSGKDQPGSIDGRLVDHAGQVVPTPDEETVFALVGRAAIPPEGRGDGTGMSGPSTPATRSPVSLRATT